MPKIELRLMDTALRAELDRRRVRYRRGRHWQGDEALICDFEAPAVLGHIAALEKRLADMRPALESAFSLLDGQRRGDWDLGLGTGPRNLVRIAEVRAQLAAAISDMEAVAAWRRERV